MRAPRLLFAALAVLATGLATIAQPLAVHAQTPPGMPPGHPSINDGDDGDDGDMPPGDSPHGANPHGAAGAGNAPKMFRPPPDGSQDDPALPVGSLVVSIRDAQDRPIPKAPITLNILHSSVARGESRETRSVQGDEDGAARFDGMPFGSGVSFQVSTTRGPASYSVMPFPLNDKNGKRVILHAYDVSNDIERLPIGTEGFVYLALKEDAIQVEQVFTVLNLGSTTWVADLPVDLPAGFRAFNKQESPDDARIEEVKGRGAALRGSFGPGRHELMFRYQVPLDDEPKQTLTMELPPHMFDAQVLAEASKSMGLEVADFPGAQRTQNQQGKRVLATEKQFPRKEGKQTLTITLTGLPTTGPGRWIAVTLAVVALGFGAAYYTQSKKDEGLDEEARRDLLDAREALLTEIVALEKAHKAGEIGPKSYAQFRASLLDALARIEAMLDAGKKPRKAHPFRSAEGAA